MSSDDSLPAEQQVFDIDFLGKTSLQRVAVPSVIAAVLGFLIFDDLSIWIRAQLSMPAVKILQMDSANQIEDFCKVTQLLFAILAGSVTSSLYEQQVSVYLALFQEVSVAKSLLEQTTLVCWGRPWYQSALACIRDYVENDLCCFDAPPAQMVSLKPKLDPLESIMYMTSVGLPGVVYDTIKDLRQARGHRLGAAQRKFPVTGLVLLYVLAIGDLLPFPLLGAGQSTAGVLYIESLAFGFLTGLHMGLLRLVHELWRRSGGIFNVDEVLQEMLLGLREELDYRCEQAPLLDSSHPSVAAARNADVFGDMLPNWDLDLLENLTDTAYT